ncbi:DUF5060 domain-containing protein [Sunxiuqinia indica]|uniref:DUF5060 domain-containing protein n=1 Tax=Sunxiuqinia indica TaxID=2692584 RepID=UPI001359A94D|nr:DUF5060 domain-containing protein [Sunxiuqinia indica]
MKANSLLVIMLLISFSCVTDNNLPEKTGTIWYPYIEWEVVNSTFSGNPFDIVANVHFQHKKSKISHFTQMFYCGDSVWRFRFTGTEIGMWDFITESVDPDLDGLKGDVLITENSNQEAHGFLTNFDSKWGWEGTEKPFVPQLVMLDYIMESKSPKAYYKSPELIENKLDLFINKHGFNGFHVPAIAGWWFNFDSPDNQVKPTMQHPDFRTFEALELLITKVHQAGGMVHIWLWGDDQRSQTPLRLKGKKGGVEDRRLQRYIASRLGPVPGWSLGYGFDLDEWVTAYQLSTWRDSMHSYMGWHHFVGGRPEGPNRGVDHTKDAKWNKRLDYSSYEHHRPTYKVYVNSIEAIPGKPVLSEDRFRIRNEKRYKGKDYTEELVRRGVYQSTMAGGVGNIWGLSPQLEPGGVFLNKKWIKTWSVFFDKKNRFLKDMKRANNLSTDDNTYIILSEGANSLVLYREDANTVQIDLSSLQKKQPAIMVDTKREYYEINFGDLTAKSQIIKFPYLSDWIVAIGEF